MIVKTFLLGSLFFCSILYTQSKNDMSTNSKSAIRKETLSDKVMVYEKIVHFTVKQEKSGEFEKWIKNNQKIFSDTLPPGWKFLGCYRTMFHMGRHTFQFRYEIVGMRAYDTLVNYENEVSEKLFNHIYQIIDRQIPMEVEILLKINNDNLESEIIVE